MAETSYEDAPPTEWLLVPGGTGLRARVEDKPGLAWLAERVKASERVLAVGTGKLLKDGTRKPLQVKEGETVLFTTWAGDEYKDTGEEAILIMREDDILAILD